MAAGVTFVALLTGGTARLFLAPELARVEDAAHELESVAGEVGDDDAAILRELGELRERVVALEARLQRRKA